MARPKMTEEEKLAARQKKQKAEADAREKANLENRLKELRKLKLNTPAILRAVGERVQHGAIKQSVIEQVLDDGKIYLLDEIVTHNNYGNPYDSHRKFYAAWHEVETYYSEKDLEKVPRLSYRDEVKINFSASFIARIISAYYHGTNMDTPYQRGHVWGPEDKVRLIDSIFNNVDIGKFVLIQLPFNDPSGCHYEILDGKQRMQAIIEFYEGRFEYKGFKFRDMHPFDRSHLENYLVHIAEVSEGMSEKQKCQYFVKLNSYGKPQDEKHLAAVRAMAGMEK